MTITDLKDETDTRTLNLALLTFPTAGAYPLMWLWRNWRPFDRITGHRTASDLWVIWIAICLGMSATLWGDGSAQIQVFLGGALVLAGNVLYIIWAFRAKAALQDYAAREHGLDLRLNAFYAFLFNVYYINYCINDLPNALQRQEMLSKYRGQPPVAPSAPVNE
ncbi:hypothetical protein LDO31_04045 [Luteimonas sp. XNQY3]|nr:hypothetical protein [Luteimonas sp. XNQY3]MCD9005419.1 hypothetical protein [Luteimonas sp. XNQY3]